MKLFARRAFVLVATLLLAACATRAREGGSQSGELAAISIINDLRPHSVVTVRIISSSGVRRILGSVPPQGSRGFTYDETSFAGQYQLTAEAADGRLVESRQLSIFLGAEVRWSLFSTT